MPLAAPLINNSVAREVSTKSLTLEAVSSVGNPSSNDRSPIYLLCILSGVSSPWGTSAAYLGFWAIAGDNPVKTIAVKKISGSVNRVVLSMMFFLVWVVGSVSIDYSTISISPGSPGFLEP
jgi:hypothetical protein